MEAEEEGRGRTTGTTSSRIVSSNGVSNSVSDNNEKDSSPGNNYNISNSDNNFNGNNKLGDCNNRDGTWGTWEELVLASAVKRHGFEDWETVAAEVQARTALSISSSATAEACRRKYSDLSLRFSGDDDAGGGVPWLEELRRLRVVELKKEVQRYDVSILSLQLKVKRLEEGREETPRGGNDVAGEEDENFIKHKKTGKKRRVQSPDLERSETGKPGGSRREDDKAVAVEEERSVNESNSTGPAARKKEDDGGAGGQDLDAKEREKGEEAGKSSESRDGGGGDSVSQVSGEAESSASLGRGRGKKERTRRERRRGEGIGSGCRDQVGPGPGKSEPLVSGLLEMIRAHRHGAVFLDRLPTPETEAYKNLVRQHMDLETIELRLEQGSYSSHFSFYRDLLLLFCNAVVFFPKTSIEFAAAQELRSLVLNEMKNEGQKSDSTLAPSSVSVEVKSELQKPDSLLNKHKVTVPLVACRKRSSMAGKTPPPSSGQKIEQQGQQKNNGSKSVSDLKPPVVELKLKSEDKPVTGTRSTRRTNKVVVKANSSPVKKQTSPARKIEKPVGPKSDKKKPEPLAGDKKRSAADFLKRIKTSSPVDAVKKNVRGGNSSGDRKDNNSREVAKDKEKTSRKSSDRRSTKEGISPPKATNGRTQNKAPETRSASASGKRGRDTGQKEAAKAPKKRARR